MAAAALLPTEIVQIILSHSTPETFHSARQVCQSWRYAAFSGIILRRQLQTMPVQLSKEAAKKSSIEELNNLFDRAAHANLFGIRHRVEKSVANRILPNEGGKTGVTAASGDGTKLAVLTGGRLEVYEVLGNGDLQGKSHQSLGPLWTSVSRAVSDGVTSWMSMAPPYASYRIALSQNGDLMAVALGRTVQMYDLRPGFEDANPVEYVLNAGRKERSATSFGWSEIKGVVENIQFVEDDTLLRITMGREGVTVPLVRVLYLGNPPPRWAKEGAGLWTGEAMSYWSVNMENVYMDSVELAQIFGGESKIFFRGLRLLPRNHARILEQEGGQFFITAVQSATKNQFCLGFVSEQNEVRIITAIPNRSERLSEEWNERLGVLYTQQRIECRSNSAELFPRWGISNIPEARTMHPTLASSEDERLWAVYEPGAGQMFSFASGGAIYICRLPNFAPSVVRGPTEDAGIEEQSLEAVTSATLQSWPFMLDTLTSDVRGLRIIKESSVAPSTVDRYVVCAETERCTFRWTIS